MQKDINQEIALAQDIANYSHNLALACDEAAKWTKRNSDLVRNEQESVLKELRHGRRVFKLCEKAAKRKMCAGVFGPSQAGKSYLISALARGEDNKLIAEFAGEEHDFISEINPPGGKESTGLVTRFTLTRPASLPVGYPVQLRLLSETDLVKIIANTYFSDFDHKDKGQKEIEPALAKLKNRAGEANGHIDLDALEDLREYLAAEFGGRLRVSELERYYWDQAFKLGPNLDLEGRIQLYSIIWDQVEEFTNLLRKLLTALDSLDYPEELYCAMNSLIPRDVSIIDVATLDKLDKDKEAGSIDVCTPAGKKMSLPRPVVTALTAELTIVMKEKPAEYFEYTDLLDFPGYRSRFKLANVREEVQKEGQLQQLFLRGKVAYLFQRYCAERELNSILLCIGNGPQEVQDLPGVINSWVCSTHGATPEEREGKQVSLLFVLTKFDTEFEDKRGAANQIKDRWDIRLASSLLNFFGQGYDWPTHWTPEKAFNNIFLLRNPNFKFKAVLEYDGDKEIGIRKDTLDDVEKLHTAFVNSALVADHFKNPQKAWDEAMRLNDGGITYIRESLTPLCDPAIKRSQLVQNINSMRETLLRRLKPFYKSDNKEETRKQKLLLIKSLFKNLGELENKQHRLGQLLHNFTINDEFIYDLYPEALRRFQELNEREDQPGSEAETTEEIDISTVAVDDWNPFAEENQETAAQENNDTPVQDEADFYAGYIESKWVENLHNLAEDANAQKFYMLPAQDFSALANELATGAARLGFKNSLSHAFREQSAYANTRKESIVRKQSAIAAHIINRYVDWLDLVKDDQEGGQRKIQLPGGKPTTIFAPNPPIKGQPHLSEIAQPYTGHWFRDWLNALAALIMDNVNFDGEHTINVAENTALGTILGKFKQTQPNNNL